ncbi:stearoyl-CoA 9-desaturase [Mycobacterium ahvazicum]|uniref:Stearoyl-CoA 9-desaturase n=1 Tax=Mycobacterium ahvazicum TaxID=1964395 RepID=A0A2K4YAD2_9MYCO|nr:fatty acid desaturase [Mycobacterium ahvazicum]SOX53734.1 stearoyl-CoA 9-desaturase [Mycobacterium ahvazicum]
MAISDIAAFAHLTDAEIEALAAELDAIRGDVEESLGERDARYIRRTIAAQRVLEAAGRLLLAGSSKRSAWWTGTVTLALAKIIENMEIGHNVMHGQWNWMNDAEIHSSTWEWDMTGVSKHWRSTHNYQHHKYTNIVGMDDDVGYALLRVTRDQPWKPYNIGNLFFNAILAFGFEWGIGFQPIEFGKLLNDGPDREATVLQLRESAVKAGRQAVKDYLAFPGLTSLSPAASYKSTLKANLAANVIRNVWADAVIFCGHFPDGAEKFAKTDMTGESRGHWYLRQMLGSANFDAGPVMRFMSGNLCYQIEHHLYPDLPSNRLREIAARVRELCDKYDLPYTTGSFLVQYGETWRTIAKLSLPDRYLRDTADDAAETRSERMFAGLRFGGTDPATGRRRGLKTALAAVRRWRRGAVLEPRGLTATVAGPPDWDEIHSFPGVLQ